MANDNFKEIVGDIVDKSKEFFNTASEKAGEYAKTAGEYAKAAGDTVTKLYSDAKAKIEIEKTEFALTKKYRELGKAYYTAKKEGTAPDDADLVNEITILLEAIEALKKAEPISEKAEEIIEETEEAAEETKEEVTVSEDHE